MQVSFKVWNFCNLILYVDSFSLLLSIFDHNKIIKNTAGSTLSYFPLWLIVCFFKVYTTNINPQNNTKPIDESAFIKGQKFLNEKSIVTSLLM